MFMIQFETLPVLLILSNAGSSSSSCRYIYMFLEHNRLRSKDLNFVAGYLYQWTMTAFMIQFETLPVLLILSNAGSSSSSCRI